MHKLILSYLTKKGIQPSLGVDTDWEILKIAGHGAIDHLDVFANDEKAQQWYSTPPPAELFEISQDLGFSLKEIAIHNMLSAMPFGNYGQTNKNDEPIKLNDAILTLAKNLNIKPTEYQQIIYDCLEATNDYAERVLQLKTLPELNKNNLINIVKTSVSKLSACSKATALFTLTVTQIYKLS